MGLQKQLKDAESALAAKADGSRLLKEEVTEDDIAEVISKWTGTCAGVHLFICVCVWGGVLVRAMLLAAVRVYLTELLICLCAYCLTLSDNTSMLVSCVVQACMFLLLAASEREKSPSMMGRLQRRPTPRPVCTSYSWICAGIPVSKLVDSEREKPQCITVQALYIYPAMVTYNCLRLFPGSVQASLCQSWLPVSVRSC